MCSGGIATGSRVAGWAAGRKPSAWGAFLWLGTGSSEVETSEGPEHEASQGRAARRARHHEKAEEPALGAGLAALAHGSTPATGEQQAQQAHGREHVHKGEQRGEPAAAVAAAVPLPAPTMPATAAAAAAMTAASMEGASIPATRAGGGSILRAAPPSSSTERRR